ncbi:MAG: phospholipase [Nitriliruptorales bacterium]|nr:phospholipase [Nitriliruptorales bacterium]
MDQTRLPVRRGPRPQTTTTNPHTQLDQQPTDPTVRERLAARVFALPGVQERPSMISVPGARALCLDQPKGPRDAFLVAGEFAHLHPPPDLSLHVVLPPRLVEATIDAGWAEIHPAARRGMIPPNVVMLYAPRDDDDLRVIESLVEASWAYAAGTPAANA